MAKAFVGGLGWVEKQTKTVDITENGAVVILPDGGKLLERVKVNTQKLYEEAYEKGYADGVASMMPKTFTVTYAYIGGGVRTFEFDKGMTWQEWCDSKYNTEGYWVNVGVYAPAPSGDETNFAVIYNDYYETYTLPNANDEIIEGHEYHYIYWG